MLPAAAKTYNAYVGGLPLERFHSPRLAAWSEREAALSDELTRRRGRRDEIQNRLAELPVGQRSSARSLMRQIALVDQRRSVVCRIARFLCDQQVRYLRSGNEADLPPLRQADIARALGEAESTISRALRHKTIDTPHGRRDMAFFCRRKADIVAHLHAAHPDWTDLRLAEELAARYACHISRRTVAYHRAKARAATRKTR